MNIGHLYHASVSHLLGKIPPDTLLGRDVLLPLAQATGQSLAELGFPADLNDRFEMPDGHDNADVWDAYVGFMAEHPAADSEAVAALDAKIAELAEQPDGDAAALDALVSEMTRDDRDTSFSLKDLLGSELLAGLAQRIELGEKQVEKALEEHGELTRDGADRALQTQEPLSELLDERHEMLETMHNVLLNVHESSMNAIQNLNADSDVGEGEAAVAMAEPVHGDVLEAQPGLVEVVVEAEPDGEVVDGYPDDDGGWVDDEGQA